MSEIDPKELLSKVSDTDIRSQLEAVFNDLSGSSLRKQVETLQEEVKTYKAEKRQRVYRDAGIPEQSFDVLDKVYEGDLTPEAVKTFAKEKGFAVPDGQPDAPEGDDPAADRAEGEARLQSVGQGALPPRDPSLNDRIAQAEANGDHETAGRLKAEKLAALRNAS